VSSLSPGPKAVLFRLAKFLLEALIDRYAFKTSIREIIQYQHTSNGHTTEPGNTYHSWIPPKKHTIIPGNNEVLPASLHFLNFIIPNRNVQNVYPSTFESKQVKQTICVAKLQIENINNNTS
jgi:hypothetical protein